MFLFSYAMLLVFHHVTQCFVQVTQLAKGWLLSVFLFLSLKYIDYSLWVYDAVIRWRNPIFDILERLLLSYPPAHC